MRGEAAGGLTERVAPAQPHRGLPPVTAGRPARTHSSRAPPPRAQQLPRQPLPRQPLPRPAHARRRGGRQGKASVGPLSVSRRRRTGERYRLAEGGVRLAVTAGSAVKETRGRAPTLGTAAPLRSMRKMLLAALSRVLQGPAAAAAGRTVSAAGTCLSGMRETSGPSWRPSGRGQGGCGGSGERVREATTGGGRAQAAGIASAVNASSPAVPSLVRRVVGWQGPCAGASRERRFWALGGSGRGGAAQLPQRGDGFGLWEQPGCNGWQPGSLVSAAK